MPVNEPSAAAATQVRTTDDRKAVSCQVPMEEIHIRTFRNSDNKECQDLFVQGKMSLLPDYYKVIVFRSKESTAFYTAMCLALIYLPSWVVALMVVGWFAVWYGIVRRVFAQYVKCQFEKDMNDIEGTYLREGGTFLVATMGGKVVGMVGGRRHKKRDNTLLVLRMNVDQRAQKRGIAGRLMRQLEQFSKDQGFRTMSLTCTVAQHAAHALYFKNGFQICETKKSVAGLSGVDICIFRKELYKE